MRHSDDPGVQMVHEFHVAFGCEVRDEPGMPVLSLEDQQVMSMFAARLNSLAVDLKTAATVANSRGRAALGLLLVRLQGHTEETGELAEAFEHQDLVAALDALTDTSYFVDGTYLTLGLGQVKSAADREVHRSNMSKLGPDGPIIGPSGRVVKGPSYSPPDLEAVLAGHGTFSGGARPVLNLVERWDQPES
jgi:predicted HAD superfamily Cof-like phosphohydrolase